MSYSLSQQLSYALLSACCVSPMRVRTTAADRSIGDRGRWEWSSRSKSGGEEGGGVRTMKEKRGSGEGAEEEEEDNVDEERDLHVRRP